MIQQKPAHHFPIRVYYEDTDAGGVVYNANYLKFAERGRTEYLREQGHNQRDILSEFNIFLVVRHAEIDYRAPAKLDDLLDLTTEIIDVGNTSLTMKQIVWREEMVLAEIKVVIVAMTPTGQAVRIPPHLRQILGG